MKRALILALALLAFSATSASAAIVAFDDFESGNWFSWQGVQTCPNTTAFQFTTSPVLSSAHAANSVITGTCPAGGPQAGQKRAELSALGVPGDASPSNPGGRTYGPGIVRYFAFSVWYPSGGTAPFPTTHTGFCVSEQIHSNQRGSNGLPSALSMNCATASGSPRTVETRFQSNAAGSEGSYLWETPMVRGHWLDVVYRVDFEVTNGHFDVWYAQHGSTYQHVLVNKPLNALLSSTDRAYFKLGMYRDPADTHITLVTYDDVLACDTYAACAWPGQGGP